MDKEMTANANVRDEFDLGIFPPDHGGNHAVAPAPTTTPAPVATSAKQISQERETESTNV